jgi:hypothetical protein
MFSKRHYEAVAAVFRTSDFGGTVVWEVLRDGLATLFEADNEKFNRAKWEEACER